MIKEKGLALCFALVLLAVASAAGHARESDLSAQAGKCLQCHAKEGIRATFPEDGESVPARVIPAAFKNSVHGILDCTACHAGYLPRSTRRSGSAAGSSSVRRRRPPAGAAIPTAKSGETPSTRAF
jgi:hypothetical protein